jgi:hypothetical protein
VKADFDSLCEFESLTIATDDKPLFLFLDSLDQMVEDDYNLSIYFTSSFHKKKIDQKRYEMVT